MCSSRGPGADVELVAHTDHGSQGQYTSIGYTDALQDAGILASVGSVGDAYDNGKAESFVDSFKTELIGNRVWRRSQLGLAIVEYVAWFNTTRLNESLGDVPPAEFEIRARSTVEAERTAMQEPSSKEPTQFGLRRTKGGSP